MSSRIGVAAILLAGGMLAAAAPTEAQTVPTAVRSTARTVAARVAEQLGIKLSPGQSEQLEVGTTLTGTLVDPAQLVRFGLDGWHPGARVTASRVTAERLRVEVDELEPVPITRRVTLTIDEKGELGVSTVR